MSQERCAGVTEIPFGEDWAGEMTDEPARDGSAGDPADRPWTPIPRQAHALERSLIPGQRRLKKTSRSA